MTSAALGEKSVEMPARKSCVRTTSTTRISAMRMSSITKMRRSAATGMTIDPSLILATLPRLVLEEQYDACRRRGRRGGRSDRPIGSGGYVDRARRAAPVHDHHDAAATARADATGTRSVAAVSAVRVDRAAVGDRLRDDQDLPAAGTAAAAGVRTVGA